MHTLIRVTFSLPPGVGGWLRLWLFLDFPVYLFTYRWELGLVGLVKTQTTLDGSFLSYFIHARVLFTHTHNYKGCVWCSDVVHVKQPNHRHNGVVLIVVVYMFAKLSWSCGRKVCCIGHVTHKSTVARTVMCRQDGGGRFPVLLDDHSKCRTNSQRKSQLS